MAYLIALEREGRVSATPLDVELTAAQHRLLDPDLRHIMHERDLDVARAELGFGTEPARLVEYTLLKT